MMDKMNNLILTLGTATKEKSLLPFFLGQKFTATVLSRAGSNYLLQYGAQLITAQSEIPLEIGETIGLRVLSLEGEKILLQTIATREVEEKELEREDTLRQLIKKYGVTTDKEIMKIEAALKKIPVAEAEAVRYLMDTHVMLALLIPNAIRKGSYDTIEIFEYGQKAKGKKIFEIKIKMDYDNLGHIQIVLTIVDTYTYIQIWSGQEDTEALLKDQIGVLNTATTVCQVIPASMGPLIRKEVQDGINCIV